MNSNSIRVAFIPVLCLLTCCAGCIAGFSREGTMLPIEEPAKQSQAKVLAQFNKATELLVEARDPRTQEMNESKLNMAIAAYKEVEKMDQNELDTLKQLGLIYEFFKNDPKTARSYYAKYKAAGGSDPQILGAIRELGGR